MNIGRNSLETTYPGKYFKHIYIDDIIYLSSITDKLSAAD